MKSNFEYLNGPLRLSAPSGVLKEQALIAADWWNKKRGPSGLITVVGEYEPADIRVKWSSPNPYAGPNPGVLGLTALPGPSFDGILHMNPWEGDNLPNFPLTVAHELGHALGYLHYNQEEHLMHADAGRSGKNMIKAEDWLAGRIREKGGLDQRLAPIEFFQLGGNPYLVSA